jgi:hypothetical protein
MKLLGITSVGFDIADQVFSAFIRYRRRNGSTMRQYISYLYTSRRSMIQLGGRYCNNLIEFGVPMKLVRLIKTCLNETQ